MAAFLPLQSVIGGIFIGVASGMYMLLSGRVAGCSGAMKALIVGPREASKLAFLAGLTTGGALMAHLLPSAFSPPPSASLVTAAAGLAVGLGTSLGNGCTSGHGLCGLSRLSLRSLAAVPTFMVAAILTATLRSGKTVGSPLPIGTTPPEVLGLAMKLSSALLAGLLPLALLTEERLREA